MQIKTASSLIKASGRRLLPALAFLILAACRGGDATSAQYAKSVPAGTSSSPEVARSSYDFVNSIGVNTHINYFDRLYGNFPLLERELASIGIRHLRDGVHFQNADYDRMLYGRWVELAKTGIRFDAAVDPRSNLGPITPQLLQRAYDLSGHSIELFEGPNELDVSGMKDWAGVELDFSETLFRAVKGMPNGAQVQIIGPSMAFAAHGAEVGDLSRRMDFGNLHSYPAGKMPSAIFPEQLDLAKYLSGSDPVIMTESGYHNALNDHHDQPAISESAAAKYITRLFLENFAHNIPRTYLYEFFDEAPDPGLKDNQLHWGLIRANGTEKPAFTAVKNLIAELNDTAEPAHLQQLAWSLDKPQNDVHHLLLQKSNGEFDLVLWQEVPSYDPRRQTDISLPALSTTLRLAKKIRSLTVYEPTIQEKAVATYSGVTQIPLQIPDHPLVVRILMP